MTTSKAIHPLSNKMDEELGRMIDKLIENSETPEFILGREIEVPVEPGLCPTFYHTLSYEGDSKIQENIWNFLFSLRCIKRWKEGHDKQITKDGIGT